MHRSYHQQMLTQNHLNSTIAYARTVGYQQHTDSTLFFTDSFTWATGVPTEAHLAGFFCFDETQQPNVSSWDDGTSSPYTTVIRLYICCGC